MWGFFFVVFSKRFCVQRCRKLKQCCGKRTTRLSKFSTTLFKNISSIFARKISKMLNKLSSIITTAERQPRKKICGGRSSKICNRLRGTLEARGEPTCLFPHEKRGLELQFRAKTRSRPDQSEAGDFRGNVCNRSVAKFATDLEARSATG